MFCCKITSLPIIRINLAKCEFGHRKSYEICKESNLSRQPWKYNLPESNKQYSSLYSFVCQYSLCIENEQHKFPILTNCASFRFPFFLVAFCCRALLRYFMVTAFFFCGWWKMYIMVWRDCIRIRYSRLKSKNCWINHHHHHHHHHNHHHSLQYTMESCSFIHCSCNYCKLHYCILYVVKIDKNSWRQLSCKWKRKVIYQQRCKCGKCAPCDSWLESFFIW